MRAHLIAATAAALLFAAPLRAETDEETSIDCTSPMATFEINACADREFQAADTALNAAYAKALKAVPGLASDPPYDAKSWEEALRRSQRAWVAFRDAECKDHVAMFWSGGSGASAEIIGCMTTKTKERTKELGESYAGK